MDLQLSPNNSTYGAIPDGRVTDFTYRMSTLTDFVRQNVQKSTKIMIPVKQQVLPKTFAPVF